MNTPSPSAPSGPGPGPRHVAVLGGGPGGLYTARLLKRARPDWEVELYEEHHPEDTFGFGVGMSSATQRNLGQSDPDTLREILDVARHGYGSRLHARSGATRLDGRDQLAIARATLLQILHRYAEKSGVTMHIGRVDDHRSIDADVVVAADGAGSPTRRALADELGATVHQGRQLYLWCSTDFALPDALFAPVHTEFGTFTTHAYPYADDRSTFLVETDEQTWRAAGLDVAAEQTPPGGSDETSIAYLQDIFADELQGHRLLGNRTRWTRFRTVRCERWHTGNVVLVGDAAHTAHYSIGSGTKLAMEDAIALCDALTSHEIHDGQALTEAFERYQTQRSSSVERLQGLADRSQLWWESYVRRLDMSPEQLVMSFVSRAGNVPLEVFAERTPDIVGPALADYAGHTVPADTAVVPWVVAQPLHTDARTFDGRVLGADDLADGSIVTLTTDVADTWGVEASALVAKCSLLIGRGTAGIRLTGPPTRAAVLRRLDLAERLRLELTDVEALIVVDGPEELLTDLAAGLVSGRTDLISLQKESTS